jgi:hypothetical protein
MNKFVGRAIERVKLALVAVADRTDIADARHVAATPGDARAFATFDRNLAWKGLSPHKTYAT